MRCNGEKGSEGKGGSGGERDREMGAYCKCCVLNRTKSDCTESD